MPQELTYKDEAAAGYDCAFARVSTHFVPYLLRAARIAPGMRVLDIAAGTGIAAEAAFGVVGPGGHVIAADFSPAMVATSSAGQCAQKSNRASLRPAHARTGRNIARSIASPAYLMPESP